MEYQDIDAKQIGSRLRELRLQKGLTHEELGTNLMISPSSVAMYETGRRVPRDEIKVKLANYFHKPVEDLFFPKKLHKT